ncbi:MAG: hypothetical protein ACRC1H_02060, partial [Caldilineaceae bacterium]
MHAFPFSVSFLVLMLVNGIVNLATTLPSAPGYIGTFDTPGILILQAFGVAGGLAAGYIFTLHVALWVPVTLVGGYYFIREHLRWSDFGSAENEVREVRESLERAPAGSTAPVAAVEPVTMAASPQTRGGRSAPPAAHSP